MSSGERLPLDARPITAYTLQAEDLSNPGETPNAVKVQLWGPGTGTSLYISHFVTCPDAAQFSGGSTRKGTGHR